MTKLTFYKNDSERVGRRHPETGAKQSVPNLDAFGNIINNHTNMTVQHFGKKGEYFVLFPPASQQAGLECELLDGDPPVDAQESDTFPFDTSDEEEQS